ncbi:hypothetical protein D1871_14500 [Nakamurella silvestris]|nr:hypothetical protein D1871_14500 [Nakamurella silvestris]
MIIVGVVLVTFIGFYSFRPGTSVEPFAVGDCVQVSGYSTVAAVGCADSSAAYAVTEAGENTIDCDSAETFAYQDLGSQPRRATSSTNLVCLWPNLQVGDCWVPAPAMGEAPLRFPRCEGVPQGLVVQRVLLSDQASSDAALCPTGTLDVMANLRRDHLLCLGDFPS